MGGGRGEGGGAYSKEAIHRAGCGGGGLFFNFSQI